MTERISETQDSKFSGAELAAELTKAKEAEADFEYRHLTANPNNLSGQETGPELRARYLRYTDKLIGKVKDLADGGGDSDGLKDTGVTMVFLDKSARPVAWMMSEMWDLYAPGYQRPKIKFANIDRLQWQEQTGRIDLDFGTSDVDVDRLGLEVIDDLHNTFVDPAHPENNDFAGRKVMVVDETRTTGTTLEIAKQMFTKAFPEAESVSGEHWMVAPKGKTADVPVWYRKDSAFGRGVLDIDVDQSRREGAPSAQTRGANFLSTRPDRPDREGLEIREEMKHIRQDVLDGKQRFSLIFQEDNEVDPKLLAAAEPWREAQRRENAKR